MSYVDPVVRPQLDALPAHLREHILGMDVRLERASDLIVCLERLEAEQTQRPQKNN